MAPRTCPTCNGSTWEHESCSTCNQSGKITDSSTGEMKDCSDCNGTGTKHYRCTECDGKGFIDDQQKHHAVIVQLIVTNQSVEAAIANR